MSRIVSKESNVGPLGVVLECEPCPECGGYPIRVEQMFDVRKEGMKKKINNHTIRIARERRAYLHCPCGACTTDWHRPCYDSDGDISVSAFDRALDSYRKKKWVKVVLNKKK